MKTPPRVSTNRFNFVCGLFATIWLGISVPVGIMLKPTVPDFEQFYIGGVLASRGEWKALYPTPRQSSLDNPGLRIHSEAKPKWKSVSKELGVWDHTHFMLPPPSALFFVPLSFFSYSQAYWLWIAIEVICILGLAFVSANLVRYAFGRSSRLEGATMLLVAISPMTARAIRIANVSPPVALTLGLALLALLNEKKTARGATALFLGAVFKYASLVLAPLLLVMRRWSMLIWLTAIGCTTIAATIFVAGSQPFEEFYKIILPTLSRPSVFRGNQSLPGMLARIFGRPLPWTVSILLNTTRLFTLGIFLTTLALLRANEWRKPINVLAAAGLLLSWLLVFSPIAWEHWPAFLCPVWGWLLWEACQPGYRRIVALLSLLLMNIPAGIFQVRGFAHYNIRIPEPFNSSQLLGVILLMALAYYRLSRYAATRDGTDLRPETPA